MVQLEDDADDSSTVEAGGEDPCAITTGSHFTGHHPPPPRILQMRKGMRAWAAGIRVQTTETGASLPGQ